MKPMEVRRNAFMICTIHRAFNAALLYYKERMCSGRLINTDKKAMFVQQ
jgi:hypothetical protein